MFNIKVYKYDSSQESNGYRGEDFSPYVLQGTQHTEDITQELDTSELTLHGLPYAKEFDPETKFIIDIVETNEYGTSIVETLHRCVARDIASQPILSDDTYFDHHISLIEPSVIAQRRLVDNIATTYKLKDVNLEERPAFPSTNITYKMQIGSYTPNEDFGYTSGGGGFIWYSYAYQNKTGKYFQPEGTLRVLDRNGNEYSTIYNDISNFLTSDGYKARFKVPKIAIYMGVDNTRNFSKIGYASIDYKIEEFDLNNEVNPTNTWAGTFISNSNLGNGRYDENSKWRNVLDHEWLIESAETTLNITIGKLGIRYLFKKYTDTSEENEPSYITDEITIDKDKKYKITLSLHEFLDEIPDSLQPSYDAPSERLLFYKRSTGEITKFSKIDALHEYSWSDSIGTWEVSNKTQYQYLTISNTTGSGYFITYDTNTGTIVWASSTPYSALALLQKAILNSAIFQKKENVYIADVNNSNLPFYIDDEFVNELSATLIIENFYNQKNLWEIMVEVGNYIHAIPELRFGEDDKFLITFSRLGRTDQHEDKATKLSIFNSRSVEDYISATSSYVTNMVQLGGVIEEWVAPKTSSENLLISNDTAEIHTTKPIIELLEIKVKNIWGLQEADLTDYIFEENVYKTLGLDYQVVPNRGLAMYYQLGDNKIIGGQYQLPQANTNIYTDYAIKKIIYSAFNGYPSISPQPTSGYWTDLKISDYVFYVKYRTKDSVRQNHVRPDLRKYLISSKHDKYPQFNQFNNQTDVVVDSIKFGNNVYGKLIKTGNSEYTVTEWVDTWANTKHKGELYKINGDLYYVAKGTHIVYADHIISEIKYSKDYNELSAVIGIPSEPRFYEISEQSLIWREVAINDYLLLTDNINNLVDPLNTTYSTAFLKNEDHLADLILGEGTNFAKYAVSVFKGDKDIDKYDQTIGQADLYKEVMNPINAYSSENTLTYEWDMIDNYSAGDCTKSVDVDTDKPIDERAYNTLQAVPYTDIYGKSALLDFYILENVPTLDRDAIKGLPNSPISTIYTDHTRPFVGECDILASNVRNYDTNFNGRGIGLLKDCREALSLNYNLQLITNSDTFVLSPFVFLPNKQNIRVVLLGEEVNKLSNGYINNATIINPFDTNDDEMNPLFNFTINKNTVTQTSVLYSNYVNFFSVDLASVFANVNEGHFNGNPNYQQVKAIAFLCDVSLDTGNETSSSTIPYKTQFIFARNIPETWNKSQALQTLYLGIPAGVNSENSIFKNKQ